MPTVMSATYKTITTMALSQNGYGPAGFCCSFLFPVASAPRSVTVLGGSRKVPQGLFLKRDPSIPSHPSAVVTHIVFRSTDK
jgi:hypothetical protein